MKKFQLILFCITLVAFVGACSKCDSNKRHDHDHHGSSATDSIHMQEHGTGMQYTSAYVCPMHCEGSGGDKPGTCPKCGMDYVKMEDHMQDGHKH
jgi:hypothetical protein